MNVLCTVCFHFCFIYSCLVLPTKRWFFVALLSFILILCVHWTKIEILQGYECLCVRSYPLLLSVRQQNSWTEIVSFYNIDHYISRGWTKFAILPSHWEMLAVCLLLCIFAHWLCDTQDWYHQAIWRGSGLILSVLGFIVQIDSPYPRVLRSQQ